ncbi:transposase family protein [Streptomyces sp. NBC_01176]|uniref:transposase family protein n=1 Tax=Streptomyces sp. NBC_01176 TaxID=2903760 RepID=UPI003866D2B7|nr:transposase family protein [Streptomyces sp. NBC_01176]
MWVPPVRPGREHDTTCARHLGLIDVLNRVAPSWTCRLWSTSATRTPATASVTPSKSAPEVHCAEAQQTYNKVVRGIHGVCERTSSVLETTFKALRRVSLDPSRITEIAAATLFLLQIEHAA